jgi:hypothetical protein
MADAHGFINAIIIIQRVYVAIVKYRIHHHLILKYPFPPGAEGIPIAAHNNQDRDLQIFIEKNN